MIDRVSQDGQAASRKMGADLVRVACVRFGFNQAEKWETFQYGQIRPGRFTVMKIDDRAVASIAVHAQRQGNIFTFPSR